MGLGTRSHLTHAAALLWVLAHLDLPPLVPILLLDVSADFLALETAREAAEADSPIPVAWLQSGEHLHRFVRAR